MCRRLKGTDSSWKMAGLDPREIENFVEQFQQHVGRILGGLQIIADLGRQFLVQGQLGHAQDGVHRRAQLVADVGQELALGHVGGFGGPGVPLQGFHQADALHGDRHMIGDGLHQVQLVLGELRLRPRAERERSDDPVLIHQGMAGIRLDAERADQIGAGIGRVLNVIDHDPAAVPRRAAANRHAEIEPFDLPHGLLRECRRRRSGAAAPPLHPREN